MKMLGVEIANDFTVTQHVQQLAMSSAQTIGLYALRVRATDPRAFHCGSAARLSFHCCRSIDIRSVVSPRHRIARASTRSSIVPVVMATARRTCRPSTTSVMLLTMNFSLKLPDCQTTSCSHYYHHHQPHHNVMTLDSASTHSSCVNTLHTYRTITFSCACYIKTNRPTRPTQFQHFSSSHCVY